MAVLFDVYDNTGGTTFSASGGTITLNLDTIREEEPSGSGSPWSLSSDQITYNDDQVVVIHYAVTAEWSSTTVSTAADGFWVALEVDTGGGYAEVDGARAYAHPETGSSGAPATCSATIARTHSSGDKYRLRVTGTGAITWSTKVDASRFTIWTDENTGGGSGAPTSAQYVTLATDATLTAERVLTGGEGVSFTDGGAGGNATLTLNAPGLTAFTSPLTSDYLIIYDDTAKAHKRITLANLQRVQTASSVALAAVSAAGGGAALGIALAIHIASMSESAFSGSAAADAVTAIQDFETNGDWRNTNNKHADAIRVALRNLSIYQNWDGATT